MSIYQTQAFYYLGIGLTCLLLFLGRERENKKNEQIVPKLVLQFCSSTIHYKWNDLTVEVMLVVITSRHSVQDCCKMLISAYNNCTKAIDFLTNRVCMSESEKSRLVKDWNPTPILFPYFWYQNKFTMWDKLSKISTKVLDLLYMKQHLFF